MMNNNGYTLSGYRRGRLLYCRELTEEQVANGDYLDGVIQAMQLVHPDVDEVKLTR